MDNGMNKLFPDFIIIGAGKSGTTSLYEYLRQHPSIYMPEVKEPNFFALYGLAKDDPALQRHFPWAVKELSTYQALFKRAQPGQLKGEASTMYLYEEQAPEQIRKFVPGAQLIAILRQPADRLYSRFMHLARENRLPSPHFEDTLDKTSIWWRRPDLIKEGFYARHLRRYMEVFPKEQLKVLLYDDLKRDTSGTVKAVLQYLGLKPGHTESRNTQFNKSGIIKNKKLDRLIGQNAPVKQAIRRMAPALYDQLRRNDLLKRTLNNLRNRNLQRPEVDPEIRYKLTMEVYGEDIRKLEEMTGHNLSHWLY